MQATQAMMQSARVSASVQPVRAQASVQIVRQSSMLFAAVQSADSELD
jgi:hypothetical protein